MRKTNIVLCLLALISIEANSSQVNGKATPAGIANCIGTVACPAGYTGSRTYTATFRYPSNVGSASQYCQSKNPTTSTISNGIWKLESDTCTPIVVAPTYQQTITENQTLTCPATTPSGTWTQKRTYEVWSDGSKKNYTAWTDVTKNCAAIKKSTVTETQTLTCPATTPSGTWTQKRTYDLWTDGAKKNYSSWVDATKTCVAIKQSTQTESRTVSCAVGEIGSAKETQTYEVWTDGTKRNYSGWKVSSSNCKAIPTKTTETKDGVQEETCDSYYGVAQGTYSGTVYKHGTYTTTYSSTAKATDTKFHFESTNVDSESCVAQITDVIQETDELACPAGQTGSIQRYRIKATNSQGQISYPYGNQWVVSNNSCASIQIDNQPTVKADTAPDGLLSNISVTSSSLQNGEAFSKYLSSLSASNWATSERHKLIVNIDDLSSGNYSASKVGAIISKFQSVVGAGNSDVEIALPMTIDKYIGNGEITAKAVKDKTVIMKDVSYREGNAKLSYMQFSKKSTEKPQTKEVMINVIPEKLGLKGVFSN